MLKVSDVHAGYAGSEVLFGVSLEVADGEGVVVLGPNGHGKTTLLRVISGLMRPTAGTVESWDFVPAPSRMRRVDEWSG